MADLKRWFKKRVEDVRDVFDANTQADQQRRMSAGKPQYYQQQQAQRQAYNAPQVQRPTFNAPSQVRPPTYNPTGNALIGMNKIIKPNTQPIGKPSQSQDIAKIAKGGAKLVNEMIVKPFVVNPAKAVIETGRMAAADVTENVPAQRASTARAWQDVRGSAPGIIGANLYDVGKANVYDLGKQTIGDITGNREASANAQKQYWIDTNRSMIGQAINMLTRKAANYQVNRDLPQLNDVQRRQVAGQNLSEIGIDPSAGTGAQLLETVAGLGQMAAPTWGLTKAGVSGQTFGQYMRGVTALDMLKNGSKTAENVATAALDPASMANKYINATAPIDKIKLGNNSGYIQLPGGKQVNEALYHGSPNAEKILKSVFKPLSADGARRNGSNYGTGLYLTNDSARAQLYGDVLNAKVPKDAKIYKVKDPVSEIFGADTKHGDPALVTKKFKELGYDGISVGQGKQHEVVVFDPSKIKATDSKLNYADSYPGGVPSADKFKVKMMKDMLAKEKKSTKETVIKDPVKDLSTMLQDMEGKNIGPKVNKAKAALPGESGYQTDSMHTPFYKEFYNRTGRPPTKQAWAAEAERLLKKGDADPELVAAYKKMPKKEVKLEPGQVKPSAENGWMSYASPPKDVPVKTPQVSKTADRVAYRTEKAHSVYKGKSVWGDGLYLGTDKKQVADMTLNPHSSIVEKPNTKSVKSYNVPKDAKIKVIDVEDMYGKGWNELPKGNDLKKQVLKEGYDGVEIKTGGDLNMGGDQIIIYNKNMIDKVMAVAPKEAPTASKNPLKLNADPTVALEQMKPKIPGVSKLLQNIYNGNLNKTQMADAMAQGKQMISDYAKKNKYDSIAMGDDITKLPTSIKVISKGGAKKIQVKVPGPVGVKIKGRASESQIPVRQVTQEKAVVTKTNVNPNVKTSVKRYAVDAETGELIPDKAGSTSLFLDDKGRVNGFRVGKETFSKKDIGDLSDTNGYGSSMATMRRNVDRSFGKETGRKVNEFLVDHQQHQATQMIDRQVKLNKELQGQADALGINFKTKTGQAKKVSAAIQDFGEKRRNKASLVEEFGQTKADQIVKTDKWFRKQYDSMLGEMNTTLKEYGYAEVPKRKDYYTHFNDEKLWSSFGLKMQELRQMGGPTLQDSMPEVSRGLISNKLAGQSEFTKPGKRFNPFTLQRKGDKHTSDAFQAFERYMTPTLNNIYMTPSIARARVLVRAIAQDADIMGKDANHIIVQTREWANRLAGKSNRFDRPIADTKGGQLYLKASRWIQKKAGSNTIVGNLSTAVMQPILLTQTAGIAGYKNTLLGAMQELSTAHGKIAPIRGSEFLRRRYANTVPVTAGKKAAIGEMANTPLKVIEETAVRISWNAHHNEALARGLKGKQAIKYADIATEKNVAGRSVGERPELYESKAAAPFTMYQLEVNNYWQQLGKEMTKTQAAKAFTAAFAMNLLLEKITGRQVGFNPIDTAIQSYKETQKQEKSRGAKAKSIAQMWGGEVVDNAPIIGPGMNMFLGENNMKKIFGPSTNVGRFGVGSPLSGIASTTKVGGVPIPQNLILPYGGAQIKKTYQGVQSMLKGKLEDKAGKTTVDIPKTPGNYARAIAFGPSAVPEVGKYYDNTGKTKADQVPVPNQLSSIAGTQGLNGLTKDQQEQYQALPITQRVEFLKRITGENAKTRANEKEVATFKKDTKATGGEMTTSTGKVVIKVGNEYKTFDDQTAADKYKKTEELKAAKESFDVSGKAYEVKGNNVYRRAQDGTVSVTTKTKYEYQVGNEELARYKASNDLNGWTTTAKKQIASIDKQLADKSIDPLDRITLLNDKDALQKNINKYAGYGAFTKGKSGSKGSKGKKAAIPTIGKIPFKMNRAKKVTAGGKPAVFQGKSGTTRKLSVSKIPSNYLSKRLG